MANHAGYVTGRPLCNWTAGCVTRKRKLGCPAHIEIKVYEVFPEYSISDSELSQNSTRTLRRVLKEYISESMRTNLPCETDRSYYPTIADINNHIYKSKTALQLSKYDQHNLLLKIEEWKKYGQTQGTFFRPFESHDRQEGSLHPAQSLLWVHQENGRWSYLADMAMK